MECGENHKKILLISDNQIDIRKIERQFMDTASMECRLYQSEIIADALVRLTKRPVDIDIIIFDLKIRGIVNILQSYQEIKTAAHDIPVILLTGTNEEDREIVALLIAAGASSFTDRNKFGQLTNLIRTILPRE